MDAAKVNCNNDVGTINKRETQVHGYKYRRVYLIYNN